MRTQRTTAWSQGLIGSDRDAARLAAHAHRGVSMLVAGPRGSGRSYLLRTIAAELERLNTPVATVRPASALASTPYAALAASNHAAIQTLRGDTLEPFDGVVIVDDIDALDTASARAIACAVATRRLTAVIGLRTARARSAERPDDASAVRRTILDLWVDGFARRVDLSELSDDDARRMIDLFPGADTLDVPTRAGLVWRADGSRTLLRQLVLESLRAVRAGRDPLHAVSTVAPDSRLAVAVERHVAGFLPQDLECLAGVRRLAHLERAVATRLFDPEAVDALLANGLLHADATVERRLTANELFALEAHRRLGDDAVDALVERAGARMLSESAQWWSTVIAVSVSERWHRLGIDASGERAFDAAVRVRVALDAARDANDRGDYAHAAAHAARGLDAADDPRLRVEADLARQGAVHADECDGPVEDIARRRIARLQSLRAEAASSSGLDGPETSRSRAEADADVERLLTEATGACDRLDARRASEIAAFAASLPDASPAGRLRGMSVAGTMEAIHGRWGIAQAFFREAQRLLDIRPHPRGISTRDRLSALTFLLVGHQIAGADGTDAQLRLERELGPAAREGGSREFTVAGIAAAIAFAGSGRPERSYRELTCALRRDPAALARPDSAMLELSVAEELALAGRQDEARSILGGIDDDGPLLVQRGRLYVETTVLVAEGRLDEARAAARAAARLTEGSTAAALRIRDLYRLVSLNIAGGDEVDELIQLAATTDLPLAADAVRRASSRVEGKDDAPIDELRLHALWSTDGAGGEVDTAAPAVEQRHLAHRSEELTTREREIALLANEGLTNREIATRLFLSVRTVESHVYQARMKVGAGSRRELARMIAEAFPVVGSSTSADAVGRAATGDREVHRTRSS